MKTIDRKLLRDAWRLRTQIVAIALVMGCGIGVFVMAWSMLASLDRTQNTYYERYRFAHVFAHLKRAPNALASRIAAIHGVQHSETRIVAEVVLDLPNVMEPAIGRCVSVPDNPAAGLNLLHLRAGRYLERGQDHEVLVSEGFANIHQLQPGDTVGAIINGRQQLLKIVGIALSPEYVYPIREGEIFPNDRTFAVFWMSRQELAAAFQLEGAFNDVSLYLSPDASLPEVIQQLDRLIDPYGGRGAYDRSDQVSNRYVTNELRELRNMGLFAPLIFVAVAAFLLNVVLSRIVGTQREQIAAIKAFGFTRREIGSHYLKFSLVVAVFGAILGIGAGAVLGRAMTQMYGNFFHFPILDFYLPPLVLAASVGVSVITAIMGTIIAVRRAVQLPPAEAMRPEPPARFKPSKADRVFGVLFASQIMRLILRNLERRPVASLLSVLGLALAISVLVLGSFVTDAVDFMINFQFFFNQRYDISVAFDEPVSTNTMHEISGLPGVIHAEPCRVVPARLRHGHLTRREEIVGLAEPQVLFRTLNANLEPTQLPEAGLVLNTKLAELLAVRPGDTLEVEVLEGRRSVHRVPVVQLVDNLIGTPAYMRWDALSHLLRESKTISAAFLSIDSRQQGNLFKKLKAMPRVASVSVKSAALESFRETLARTLLRMRDVNIIFAAIIACGVVYNSAKISLEEQSRELATMRVLGFSRVEVSFVLLDQLAIQVLVAVPIGLVLGYWFAVITTWGYDTELFRVPVIIHRSTYALAATTVILAAAVSGLIVRRKLDQLDLIAVLKAGE